MCITIHQLRVASYRQLYTRLILYPRLEFLKESAPLLKWTGETQECNIKIFDSQIRTSMRTSNRLIFKSTFLKNWFLVFVFFLPSCCAFFSVSSQLLLTCFLEKGFKLKIFWYIRPLLAACELCDCVAVKFTAYVFELNNDPDQLSAKREKSMNDMAVLFIAKVTGC